MTTRPPPTSFPQVLPGVPPLPAEQGRSEAGNECNDRCYPSPEAAEGCRWQGGVSGWGGRGGGKSWGTGPGTKPGPGRDALRGGPGGQGLGTVADRGGWASLWAGHSATPRHSGGSRCRTLCRPQHAGPAPFPQADAPTSSSRPDACCRPPGGCCPACLAPAQGAPLHCTEESMRQVVGGLVHPALLIFYNMALEVRISCSP